MKRTALLSFEFVEAIPSELKDGKLYISLPYATVAHKCCCGCGSEVVTPLSPTDWKLTFDGVSMSLHPSIGNWSFACQSHYWIDRNRVRWADRWTPDQIAAGRSRDLRNKHAYDHATPMSAFQKPDDEMCQWGAHKGLWSRFLNWWSRR